MLQRLFTVFSAVVVLTACQTTPQHTPQAETAQVEPEAREVFLNPVARPKEKPPADLWERVRRGLSWQSIHNEKVGHARDHYLKQPRYPEVVAERASLYLYYIVDEVERRGLPMELALLPLVESTLNPFAVSSERAAGLWQIMPATGKYLGLHSDWWYDGRKPPQVPSALRSWVLPWLMALSGDMISRTMTPLQASR